MTWGVTIARESLVPLTPVLAFALEAGPNGAAHVHVSMQHAQQLLAASDHTTYVCNVSGFQVSMYCIQDVSAKIGDLSAH